MEKLTAWRECLPKKLLGFWQLKQTQIRNWLQTQRAPWWKRWKILSPQEKYIMLAILISAAVLLLYATLWAPLNTRLAHQRDQLTREEKINAPLFSLDRQIQLLGKKPKTLLARAHHLSLTTIREKIKKSSVKNNLKTLSTLAPDKILCRFEQVNFDTLITWLISFTQQENLIVEKASLEKINHHGQVQAEFIISS